MNKVTLGGRLTKDVSLNRTQNGKEVAKFTLAVKKSYAWEGEPQADFIPCVVWDKQAENCANYIGKGHYVTVEGRLQVRSYEDSAGVQRYVTEVVANTVEFVSAPKKAGNAA